MSHLSVTPGTKRFVVLWRYSGVCIHATQR